MSGRKSKVKRERAISRAMGISHTRKQRRTSRRREDDSVKVEGVFSYSGRGFGFCVPDSAYGMPDIFIPPRKTMGAMTGDRVTVTLTSRGEKPEGEVLSAAYASDSIIGTLTVTPDYAFVTPDARRYGVLIYVPLKDVDVSGASDGDKVEVVPAGEDHFTRTRSITVRGPRDMPYFDTMGRISSVFGSSLSRDANYAAILYASGIRTEFPEAVLRHADEVSREPLDPAGRVDLRGKRILTIDGAGAKDLDDAISLEKAGENWILGVHIADVSHYVRQGTPTEAEAVLRGTSVYFTDKVVPMLPESLSNGACSLNAGEDKYALTAEVTLDAQGRRLGTRIFKSLLRSTVRGVYSEVNDLFADGEASEYYEKYAAVYPMLRDMHGLYEILRDASAARNAMELEDSEAVILLDENGEVADVVCRERGDGERLIEQFMLQANMGVAEVLHRLGLPCLYRIHESPDAEKLHTFAIFAHNVGLDVRGLTEGALSGLGTSELSARLMGILTDANARGIGGIVSSVLLRSMMKAKYQAVCAPHFGLGVEEYCHFTSPIRRYPDLFVHTVISTVLERSGLSELTADSAVTASSVPELLRIAAERGESSTECEIRAQNAEREIEDLYMALYMSHHIGETFDVIVSSVIRSGIFVQCPNLIEGFVPLTCFPGARVNEEAMRLTAPSGVLTLGSPLRVRLTSVDVSGGKITFEPEGETVGTVLS